MKLLEMKSIVKDFPQVRALDHVDLQVKKGEIHALLGENGAGKTTLMNILYGLYQQDQGDILWRGRSLQTNRPSEAIHAGIGMVHQHFMLVKRMTALDNILLGLRLHNHPFINNAEQKSRINSLASKYEMSVDLHRKVSDLAVGEQQRVEILKALFRSAELLILDEPTGVLTPQETKEFFQIMQRLRDDGHSIIFISHNLDEILEISDQVTIMRDGKNVCTLQTKNTNSQELSRCMIGREFIKTTYNKDQLENYDKILDVENLCLFDAEDKLVLNNISFHINNGEILGLAGVDGNGQLELSEVLCGIRKQSSGHIKMNDAIIDRYSVRRRSELGLSYIPSDRHQDGLIMDADLSSNYHLKDYYRPPNAKKSILKFKQMHQKSYEAIEAFNIKAPSTNTVVRLLSGGNQQKLILAREIASDADLTVACQPTRGLDVGATEYVRSKLVDLRNKGKSVFLVSTDLEEVLALSDRIAVIFDGQIMGILENSDELSVETLGLLMGGQTLSEVKE